MMGNIRIWDIRGNSINLNNYGMIGLALIPESPSYEYHLEKVPGSEGMTPLGKDLNARNIVARFLVKSFDYTDSLVKTDQIYDLLNGDESFYIAETNQPGKRWLVDSVDSWSPERYNKTTFEFTLNLIAIKGRAESTGTTLQSSTFEYLDLPVTYTDYEDIRATKFRIFNPGKTIDPRSIHNFLKITYKGESDNLRIKNLTTGDTWAYSGSSNSNDTIVLEGIRSTKNGLSIFRQTNKRLITLANGWNDFEISGAPNAQRYAVQAHMPRKKMPSELKPNPITFEFKFRF